MHGIFLTENGRSLGGDSIYIYNMFVCGIYGIYNKIWRVHVVKYILYLECQADVTRSLRFFTAPLAIGGLPGSPGERLAKRDHRPAELVFAFQVALHPSVRLIRSIRAASLTTFFSQVTTRIGGLVWRLGDWNHNFF